MAMAIEIRTSNYWITIKRYDLSKFRLRNVRLVGVGLVGLSSNVCAFPPFRVCFTSILVYKLPVDPGNGSYYCRWSLWISRYNGVNIGDLNINYNTTFISIGITTPFFLNMYHLVPSCCVQPTYSVRIVPACAWRRGQIKTIATPRYLEPGIGHVAWI